MTIDPWSEWGLSYNQFFETDCILNVLSIVWLTFEPWSVFEMAKTEFYSVSKNGEVLIVTVYVISPLYGFNKSF